MQQASDIVFIKAKDPKAEKSIHFIHEPPDREAFPSKREGPFGKRTS